MTKQAVNLEELIDQVGLSEVLSLIANICEEKAEHVMSSYGDIGLAGLWSSAGSAVAKVTAFRSVKRVSP